MSGTVGGTAARIGDAQFTGCEPLTAPGNGKTVTLSLDGRPAAVFTVQAPVRGDARQTIEAMKDAGLGVEMLSGDNETHCAEVAHRLAIDYRPALTPEDKNETVTRAGSCMFVGDGINDIPAITRAGLSVSTLETNDLVKSRADVVLLTPRLLALVDLVRIGRFTQRIMRENLAWALAYNVIAIPAAALGYAPPWAAALGMSASSVLVMLNATRLLGAPLARERG